MSPLPDAAGGQRREQHAVSAAHLHDRARRLRKRRGERGHVVGLSLGAQSPPLAGAGGPIAGGVVLSLVHVAQLG
jgi:hypothetical protein